MIFDPEETYRIDKNTFASKGRNTPFDGKEVTGRVKCTICDGEVVFNELNTMPGFTSISMYPMLWANKGLDKKTLVDKLIRSAFNRHK